MLKKIFGCLLTCLLVLCLSACQSQPPKQEEVSSIEIGETYEAVGFLKLLDQKRYVYSVGHHMDFQSQQDLEDYQKENGPSITYPNLYFEEGTYEKVGDTYQLTPSRSARLIFKNVESIQEKFFAKKSLSNPVERQYGSFILEKAEKTYTVNGKQPVLLSSQELPNSVEDFLESYTERSENLPEFFNDDFKD